MRIEDFDKNHFGTVCEAIVLSYLPQRPIWCAKDYISSYIDIDWQGIRIEIKGNRNKKPSTKSYYFMISHFHALKLCPEYQKILEDNNKKKLDEGYYNGKYKYMEQTEPDVYVFVGWKKDECTFWIINGNKFKHKECIAIPDKNRFWNKYKVTDPKQIPYKIAEEANKKYNVITKRISL